MSKELLEKINKRLEKLEGKFEVKKELPKKNFPFVKDLDAIYILGRGQSLGRCPEQKPANVEYWGCNNVYRARKLDRLFIMRNPYIVQCEREPKLIEELNEHEFPVYTLGEYPEIKNNLSYPIEDVVKEYSQTGEGGTYLLNNAAFMMALAIMQKPKAIYLFGVDMAYGTNNEYMYNEKACCEAWLGMAHGRGIKFMIAEGSTLLKRKSVDNYYGLKYINDGISNRLEPKWSWGNPQGKCAIRYTIRKVQHNL